MKWFSNAMLDPQHRLAITIIALVTIVCMTTIAVVDTLNPSLCPISNETPHDQ